MNDAPRVAGLLFTAVLEVKRVSATKRNAILPYTASINLWEPHFQIVTIAKRHVSKPREATLAVAIFWAIRGGDWFRVLAEAGRSTRFRSELRPSLPRTLT